MNLNDEMMALQICVVGHDTVGYFSLKGEVIMISMPVGKIRNVESITRAWNACSPNKWLKKDDPLAY